jgi:predicted lysophospholipase L1 biosynthesis ABC-type transport system permease subunit
VLGGRTAVGARVTTPLVRAPVTIVGVVGDITPAGEAERPAIYVPTEQLAIGGGYLLVSAHGDPRAVVPLLIERLRAAAPALALDRMRPVADMLAESRALATFTTELALVFAALAVLLSVVGVYGLVSGEVAARWREIAIRVALGSSQHDVLWAVIKPSVVLLAAGALVGAAGALGAGRALTSLLRGVGASDGPTLAAAAGLLWMTGVAAAFVAGSRVLGTDPAAILRNE